MRTTLDIEDDVLQAAKELATSERSTAGAVLSKLARAGLKSRGRASGAKAKTRNGVPIFPGRKGEVITLGTYRSSPTRKGSDVRALFDVNVSIHIFDIPRVLAGRLDPAPIRYLRDGPDTWRPAVDRSLSARACGGSRGQVGHVRSRHPHFRGKASQVCKYVGAVMAKSRRNQLERSTSSILVRSAAQFPRKGNELDGLQSKIANLKFKM